MADLATCVHPGVRTARDDERGGRLKPQDRTQRRLELSLDGALARLTGPASEAAAVVGHVEPQSYELASTVGRRGWNGCGNGQEDVSGSSEPWSEATGSKPAASAASALANHTSGSVWS